MALSHNCFDLQSKVKPKSLKDGAPRQTDKCKSRTGEGAAGAVFALLLHSRSLMFFISIYSYVPYYFEVLFSFMNLTSGYKKRLFLDSFILPQQLRQFKILPTNSLCHLLVPLPSWKRQQWQLLRGCLLASSLPVTSLRQDVTQKEKKKKENVHAVWPLIYPHERIEAQKRWKRTCSCVFTYIDEIHGAPRLNHPSLN